MTNRYRIGLQIEVPDPFWVQVRESILLHIPQITVELVELTTDLSMLARHEFSAFVEELRAHDLHALIGWDVPDVLLLEILHAAIPVVHLNERSLSHPWFTAPQGLYDVAQIAGTYLVEQLGGRGHILIVGGLAGHGEDGRSRLSGISDLLKTYPAIQVTHIPSLWHYDQCFPVLCAALEHTTASFDAVFGLSDSLALAARDAALLYRRIQAHTQVVGINGDPLAIAAIVAGQMTATVETSAMHFGQQAAALACQAAQRHSIPARFSLQPRLITAACVAEVAAQKLIALAGLPNRLVGINRQREQQRLVQLETTLAVNQRLGALLDRQQLAREISDLIRSNYGYDQVFLYRWLPESQQLTREVPPEQTGSDAKPLAVTELLAHVLQRGELLFIPDTQHSQRFAPDPHFPTTRSRVILPVRFGEHVVAVLDLHSEHGTRHSREALVGLQVLADQLGIALRNAELYSEALVARAAAEQADQLKTQLLANVSHELRTPLDSILGYSQAASAAPDQDNPARLPGLLEDIAHIHRSGKHLWHLINDLLDISRADIGELELVPEIIDPHAFLSEVFASIARKPHDQITWQLDLPARLPLIHGDPTRLRQVVLNLLNNAQKFTVHGQITLGADVALPHLHLWVRDTGAGISAELQQTMFEPFVTGRQPGGRHDGVGLGLAIVRRLVMLHHGSIQVESQPGCGSTFHVYVPLLAPGDHVPPCDSPITSVLLKPLGPHTLSDLLAMVYPASARAPIVIVDDDPEARALYARIAATISNAPVRTAADGRAAIALLEHTTPGLVVLDLMMPEVDGFAVLAWMRACERTRTVPVVVISGRVLSLEDINQLNGARITFQSKEILDHDEMADMLLQTLEHRRRVPPQSSRLVKRTIAYMQQHSARTLTRREIADAVGLSPHYLSQIFQQELGLSPWEYLHRYRVKQAKQLLDTTATSIGAIAAQVGFENASYFGRVFQRHVGCSPRAYRDAAREAQETFPALTTDG